LPNLKRDNNLDYKPTIVVSTGAKQSHNIAQVMLNDGEVILPAPYSGFYFEIVKLSGGVPVSAYCYRYRLKLHLHN
jgi:aspartate aminotransferase